MQPRNKLWEHDSTRRMPTLQAEAAVDGQDLAGDEVRRGGEEHYGGSYIFPGPVARRRSLFAIFFMKAAAAFSPGRSFPERRRSLQSRARAPWP